MLHWVLIFLVIAIIAGICGFSLVLAPVATAVAKALFFLFLGLAVYALLAGGLRGD